MQLRLLVIFLINCLICTTIHAQGNETKKDSAKKSYNVYYNQHDSVLVNSVIKKYTKNDLTLNQISYSYKFKERNTVFIQDIGDVPSEGAFNYLTTEKFLVFKESDNGKILTQINLKITSDNFGSNTAEIPDDGDFPEFFESGNCNYSKIFAIVVIETIQKYFPSGYLPNTENKINSFKTTFARLKVSRFNLESEIAIKISEPFDIKMNKMSYRIYYVIRDKPRFSDTWNIGKDADPLTLKAAQSLIKNLITDINGHK